MSTEPKREIQILNPRDESNLRCVPTALRYGTTSPFKPGDLVTFNEYVWPLRKDTDAPYLYSEARGVFVTTPHFPPSVNSDAYGGSTAIAQEILRKYQKNNVSTPLRDFVKEHVFQVRRTVRTSAMPAGRNVPPYPSYATFDVPPSELLWLQVGWDSKKKEPIPHEPTEEIEAAGKSHFLSGRSMRRNRSSDLYFYVFFYSMDKVITTEEKLKDHCVDQESLGTPRVEDSIQL